jgi:hypothetical protein
MKKFLALVFVGLVGVSGCALTGDKAHCGFHFEILKPPTIDTSNPVLVQQTPGMLHGQPMGTISGPMGGQGQFQQGPMLAPPMALPCEPISQATYVPRLNRLRQTGPEACPPGCLMSSEDWARVMQEMRQQQQAERLPLPKGK